MPQYECPYPECTYTTGDINDELAAVMMRIHAEVHISSKQKAAKVDNVRRPVISAGGTSEEWSYFNTRWTEYKMATKITHSTFKFNSASTPQ